MALPSLLTGTKEGLSMKKYMIFLALIVLGSCTKENDFSLSGGRYTLTVNASKAPQSKALNLSGSTLNASWQQGEKVDVYRGEDKIGELTAQSTASTTRLSGELTVAPSANEVLTLKFLSPSYASQDGTLAYIAANCDYATASVTVKSIAGGNVTIKESSALFTNQQAIVKFTLKDKADGTTPVSTSSLVVNAGGTSFTVTAAAVTNVFFVAIPAISSQVVTLSASDGIFSYTYEKASATFANGKYYEIVVMMNNTTDFLSIPLTFEAKTAGAVVSFSSSMDTTPAIEYSKNGGAWTAYSSGITLNNVGDRVSFRGNNATYASISDGKYSSFSCTNDCYIYGNIMSLISKDGFASATSLTENDVFYLMFYNNTHICNHASKTLKLPATTLTQYCYHGLFYGCSNLTKAPELPATTLAFYCYAHMFSNCTHLTTAPALPVTTLATSCYRSMFQGCTSLTTAPALPATTLASSCYTDMFQGCTSLTTAPAALPATTLADYCYQQMFYGCTSLTTAPILPATELKTQCYYCMFLNCLKLNSVICLATDISASNCTGSWLNGVAASGTFYKASTMSSWPVGPQGTYGIVSGIPSNWTVENYVPGALSGKFTINAGGGKVYFSQGNLRALYKNSTWSWELAPHQWDFVGDGSANININGNGTVGVGGFYVDLFGWVGVSSDWTGAAQYGISNSTATNDTNGYGNVVNEALKSDWGNTIGSGWRTLTKDEWIYLFNTRTVNGGTGNGKSYTLGQSVNGKLGVVIYPDNYTGAVYSGSDWASFEAAGCVFLPAAGYRSQAAVYSAGSIGYYWSSTPSSADNAYSVYFNSGNLYPAYNSNRSYGSSVRLVRPVE